MSRYSKKELFEEYKERMRGMATYDQMDSVYEGITSSYEYCEILDCKDREALSEIMRLETASIGNPYPEEDGGIYWKDDEY